MEQHAMKSDQTPATRIDWTIVSLFAAIQIFFLVAYAGYVAKSIQPNPLPDHMKAGLEIFNLESTLSRTKVELEQCVKTREDILDLMNRNAVSSAEDPLQGASPNENTPENTIDQLPIGQLHTQLTAKIDCSAEDLTKESAVSEACFRIFQLSAELSELHSRHNILHQELASSKARELKRIGNLPKENFFESAHLPQPWTAHLHPNGNAYFYNHRTGKASWYHPHIPGTFLEPKADQEDANNDEAISARSTVQAQACGANTGQKNQSDGAGMKGFLSSAGPYLNYEDFEIWSGSKLRKYWILAGQRLWQMSSPEFGSTSLVLQSIVSISLWKASVRYPTSSKDSVFYISDRTGHIWQLEADDPRNAQSWAIAVGHSIAMIDVGENPRTNVIPDERCDQGIETAKSKNFTHENGMDSLNKLQSENRNLKTQIRMLQGAHERLQQILFAETEVKNTRDDTSGKYFRLLHISANDQFNQSLLGSKSPQSQDYISQIVEGQLIASFRLGSKDENAPFDAETRHHGLLQSLQQKPEARSQSALGEYSAVLYALSSSAAVQTICQVGLGAGHEALAFLMGNPWAHLITFDLLRTVWAQGSSSLFHELFGARYSSVKKESENSYGKFFEMYPDVRCNLTFFHADGEMMELRAAIPHFAIAGTGSLVLFDGTPCAGPKCAEMDGLWEESLAKGIIVPVSRHPLEGSLHGFSLGRFAPGAEHEKEHFKE